MKEQQALLHLFALFFLCVVFSVKISLAGFLYEKCLQKALRHPHVLIIKSMYYDHSKVAGDHIF